MYTSHGIRCYLIRIIDIYDAFGGYIEILIRHYVFYAVSHSTQVAFGLGIICLRDKGIEQKRFYMFIIIIYEEVFLGYDITCLQVVVLGEEVVVSMGTTCIFIHLYSVTPDGGLSD